MSIHKLSESCSVTGQITPADLNNIAEMGFKSVICNRPDSEGMMQPSFSEIEAAATSAGMTAKYLPVTPGPVNLSDAQKMQSLLETLEGPVLAFCGSGARSANLWNMCGQIGTENQSAA